MAVLNLILVRKFSAERTLFNESWQGTTGMILMDYFKPCITGSYSSVDYWWDRNASSVTDFDLVCYCLEDQGDSILVKHGGASKADLGFGGSTQWSKTQQAMICEVYLTDVIRGGDPRGGADGARDWAVANIIFHELMHSCLDAGPGAPLRNVHKIPNGVLGTDKPLNSSMRASDADKAAMRQGLAARKSGLKQFTGAM
ncbi:hypothetical protein [Roseomonas indoligenes]|uniref:Uncharacterized protein n=1 Tax=Roseomonas indoligenes TaxID=2820811 RepID=A0A940MX47_9PROT|nr:hypothetical protein [Pararoseomonas indoligenes]MBP0495858.1 hypothetical protein [Pararoseomonas indoligenes]